LAWSGWHRKGDQLSHAGQSSRDVSPRLRHDRLRNTDCDSDLAPGAKRFVGGIEAWPLGGRAVVRPPGPGSNAALPWPPAAFGTI
jgi:hypothetical protein